MSNKPTSYAELIAERKKLEAYYAAQKELVQFEFQDLKKHVDPAFKALHFLEKLTIRNRDNPILNKGIALLIDLISDKTKGEDAGILRSTVIPFIIKNFASNFLADSTNHFIDSLGVLFNNNEEAEEEILTEK